VPQGQRPAHQPNQTPLRPAPPPPADDELDVPDFLK
jgi:hypothetical protein